LGINISTPPEALHANLFGHGICLLNVFREQKEKKNNQDKEQEQEQEQCYHSESPNGDL